MSPRLSPINDLYGATAWREPSKRRNYLWLILLAALALFLVIESVRPVMRLRSDPPPEVIGASVSSNAADIHAQQRVAQACWDYAAQYLQESYPYGESLPESPTLGFVKAPKIRTLCWPRLRKVWTQNSTWVRTYHWSTEWLTDSQGPIQQTLRKLWDDLHIPLPG